MWQAATPNDMSKPSSAILSTSGLAEKEEQLASPAILPAASKPGFAVGHPFMLELASCPLMKLPCSPLRTIPAFGRLARMWSLHELSGRRQRRHHFGTLQTIGGLHAVGVGSGRARA